MMFNNMANKRASARKAAADYQKKLTAPGAQQQRMAQVQAFNKAQMGAAKQSKQNIPMVSKGPAPMFNKGGYVNCGASMKPNGKAKK